MYLLLSIIFIILTFFFCKFIHVILHICFTGTDSCLQLNLESRLGMVITLVILDTLFLFIPSLNIEVQLAK